MLTRFETFILNITEIDLYWHRVASAAMKDYGLKGNYVIYFTRLHGHPEGVTAAQLAAECGKDKADVSRDIAVLEKLGLVRRLLRDGSAYRALLMLTERGRQLTAEIIRKAEQAVDCIGGGLTDEDRACFYRVLATISDNLQTLSQTGLPSSAGNDDPEKGASKP